MLLFQAFADLVKSDFGLARVGETPVRGFNDPIELFAYGGVTGDLWSAIRAWNFRPRLDASRALFKPR